MAVTAVAALIVAVQPPVPEHAPVHPEKTDPVAGVAVSVTAVPELKVAVQVEPQLTPAGAEETVPVPVPCFATVSEKLAVEALKVAVTLAAAFSVTTQVDVPEHEPLHPAKAEPAAGVAVSVTAVPVVNVAVQVAPQSSPAGTEEIVPLPVPCFATARA